MVKKLSVAYGVEIIGTQHYITQIRKALWLLKSAAPKDFATVKKYIGRVEQFKRSGMSPWEHPPTFYLSEVSAFHSLTWCASSLVHDSIHSKLYLEYLKRETKVPPLRVWSGRKIELLCIEKQIKASLKIGAPESEIAHLRKLDGLHYRLGEKQWW